MVPPAITQTSAVAASHTKGFPSLPSGSSATCVAPRRKSRGEGQHKGPTQRHVIGGWSNPTMRNTIEIGGVVKKNVEKYYRKRRLEPGLRKRVHHTRPLQYWSDAGSKISAFSSDNKDSTGSLFYSVVEIGGRKKSRVETHAKRNKKKKRKEMK